MKTIRFHFIKYILHKKHNKQVFSRKIISKTHIISIYSVKNDGEFETFLWYVIHKMASHRGNYCTKRNEFKVHDPKNPERNYTIITIIRENCLSTNNSPRSIFIPSEFPQQLLEYLLGMMDLHDSVSFTKDSRGTDTMVVLAPYYTALDIESAIKCAIETTMYRELSVSDANTIIKQLGLSQYVYCIEGHESGACLVVFEKKRYLDGIDAQKVFRDMVNGLQKSGQSSTKTIQISMRQQLQLQAIKAKIEILKRTKSDIEQAIRLRSNSSHETAQLTRTNAEIELLKQRKRDLKQAM